MEVYPLKFHPIFKQRLWGGNKLRTFLGKDVSGEDIGESWELSGVAGDVSVIANGPYAGKSLWELIETFPEGLLGTGVLERFGTEFPILIKFLHAREDLSIQLHPGDDLARRRHNSFGKTEMWYILDAEPGSELIIGFNRDVSREEYLQALEGGKLLDLLHYEPVREGDAFFINNGKIHAIGGGIVLAEIQQSSDVTYRIYDFDRRDANGNLRELHTELALEAMDFQQKDDFRRSYGRKRNQPNPMVDSAYFKTAYLEVDKNLERDLRGRKAFTIFLCVGGQAVIAVDGQAVQVRMGETVLVPAAAGSVQINSGGCRLLEVSP
ncbi:type I phosphomannose isomerase catalytic subunit [Robiginitalea marina]|uniref:Phosphohexomutase n=1 Tax=Robiginitalea marina TaxID=2954105 RepID=A0ABT1AZR9_9FLAO|nr:type I phosphomannose isomerase catalytic subunit [Robiginitalea marina]MCO5725511.1 class I mannose-6-phosphate isomerase [Robiginitalea marina]